MSVSIPQNSATPQVRSRSVSLRIGPFGLTYATDQVVWPDAATDSASTTALAATSAATTAASAASAMAAEPTDSSTASSSSLAAPVAAAVSEAQASNSAGALAASRSFARDLEAARRQAVFARQAELVAQPEKAQGRSASDTTSERKNSLNSQQRPASSRMRQAISAYLACASSFGQARPMLTAVA
jgi:hypothetical protein